MTTTAREKGARTCVGCHTTHDREALVRLVQDDGASVIVDAAGSAFGRGVHVHPSPTCIEKAARGGLAKSLRAPVKIGAHELAEAIREAYARRATGLLVAARRQHAVAIGADASVAELSKRDDAVVVVASDAAHAAGLSEVQRAVKEGRAVVWLNRTELGRIFNREEVAVCVVMDGRIGAELVRTNQVRSALAMVTESGGQSEERGVRHAGLGRFDE